MKATRLATTCLWVLGLLLATGFAAEEPKYGAIEITGPAGAKAYVEGFLAGDVPVNVEQVVPGSYRVVVKKAGNGDFAQDVSVTAGQIARVEAKLSEGGWSSPVRKEDEWKPITDADKSRYEKARSTVKLGQYKVLEISNFLMKSDEAVPPDHLYALVRDLAVELNKKTPFEKFVTNYTKGPSSAWIQSDPGADVPTLVLSGVITRYQRGSRAARYMVGFGAGKTRAYCVIRLVDKQTGEVLLERMENGSVSMGLFGGGSAGAMKELADDLAKAVKNSW